MSWWKTRGSYGVIFLKWIASGLKRDCILEASIVSNSLIKSHDRRSSHNAKCCITWDPFIFKDRRYSKLINWYFHSKESRGFNSEVKRQRVKHKLKKLESGEWLSSTPKTRIKHVNPRERNTTWAQVTSFYLFLKHSDLCAPVWPLWYHFPSKHSKPNILQQWVRLVLRYLRTIALFRAFFLRSVNVNRIIELGEVFLCFECCYTSGTLFLLAWFNRREKWNIPALVIACLYFLSCTSPAANTPSMFV